MALTHSPRPIPPALRSLALFPRSFARAKSSTPFLSIASALFVYPPAFWRAQNTRGRIKSTHSHSGTQPSTACPKFLGVDLLPHSLALLAPPERSASPIVSIACALLCRKGGMAS